jgi:hypothetical protein
MALLASVINGLAARVPGLMIGVIAFVLALGFTIKAIQALVVALK